MVLYVLWHEYVTRTLPTPLSDVDELPSNDLILTIFCFLSSGMPPTKRPPPIVPSAVTRRPSQKQICDTLMIRSKDKHERDTIRRDGTAGKAMYYRFTCRRCGVVKWKDVTAGPTNAYNHLVGCYGSTEAVEEVYLECRKRMMLGQGQSIDSYLKASKATPREDAVYDWINVIVEKSMPLAYVEDDTMRSFSRHTVRLSKKYIKDVIYKLVELVEKAVGDEMKHAPIGAIMHDGWSKVSTHYFGLYACYSLKVGPKHKPHIALLAVAPIQETDNGDSDDDQPGETATFDADAHCRFIRETFKFYGAVDFDSWCVAQICDNASVNRSIALKLGIKHIGCKSHQLALDVKEMLKTDTRSAELLEQVHQTMVSIKTKNSNAALLRNVTDLKPVLDNKTRWSGKYSMVDRYCQIYEEIVQASQEDNASIEISEAASIAKARKVRNMLAEINVVTVALQESMVSLAQGRRYLDELIRQVNKGKLVKTHALYQCKLKLQKSALVSNLAPNHVFESGVIKIQSGNWEDLTPEEEEECSILLKEVEDQPFNDTATSESPIKMQDRIKRIKLASKQSETKTNPYYDLSFLFASAAEVERLWSKALYIFVQQRRRMHPQLLEGLLYLKENRRFWDKSTVLDAMQMLKKSDGEEELLEVEEEKEDNSN